MVSFDRYCNSLATIIWESCKVYPRDKPQPAHDLRSKSAQSIQSRRLDHELVLLSSKPAICIDLNFLDLRAKIDVDQNWISLCD